MKPVAVLLLLWRSSKSSLLDMLLLGCLCWRNAMKKRPIWSFPPLYYFFLPQVKIINWFNIQDIDFLYNVQHDCPLAGCTASGRQAVMQERTESGHWKAYIKHKPLNRFVINTHAFHNAHLLRSILPRSLVAPILIHQDREAKHHEISRSLRSTQEVKRSAQKARASQKKQEIEEGNRMHGSGSNKRSRVAFETEQDEEGLD